MMLLSAVLPFAVAVLALSVPNPARRKGCQGADCSKVPPPMMRGSIVSVRDDRCQYSCHLRRLQEAAIAREATPKPEKNVIPDVAGVASVVVAKQDDKDFKDAHTIDLYQAGSAIAAVLSGNTKNLKRRANEAAAPQAGGGQFDVAVTSIPRRSEGICKFAIDVNSNPAEATPSMSCKAGGSKLLDNFSRGTAGLLAARLAAEYDPNCALTEKTSYHVNGDPKASFALFQRDDNRQSRDKKVGHTMEYFFLDCGAVFLSNPDRGSSGSGQVASIRMIRDSRGFMPLLAEWLPAEVFASQKSGGFSANAPPPWYSEASALKGH